MKPVRILFRMFLLYVFGSLLGSELTYYEKHRINLFSQFVNKRDCARSGSFQHKLQHRWFQRLPAFITSLY